LSVVDGPQLTSWCKRPPPAGANDRRQLVKFCPLGAILDDLPNESQFFSRGPLLSGHKLLILNDNLRFFSRAE
jgi:hypothetical protein